MAADPCSATLLALQRQVAERLEQAEQISRQKEAELLAEIEVENGGTVENPDWSEVESADEAGEAAAKTQGASSSR